MEKKCPHNGKEYSNNLLSVLFPQKNAHSHARFLPFLYLTGRNQFFIRMKHHLSFEWRAAVYTVYLLAVAGRLS